MGRDAMRIPRELADFLKHGKKLSYRARACECGRVELCSLRALHAEEIAVEFINYIPVVEDPHEGESGLYLTDSVNLINSCEGYDPEHVLCWLPRIGCFGAYDVEHCHLTLFPGKTWADIERSPVRFLNAQWREPRPGFSERALPTMPGIVWAAGRRAPRKKKRSVRRPARRRERFRPAAPSECKAKPAPGQLFWIMTKGTLNPRLDHERWDVSIPDIDDVRALGYDPPDLKRTVVATARRATGLEDVPRVYSHVLIVSDRVRDIFESAGPGDCLFNAIEIRCRGRPIRERYWAVSFVREIDCLDPARSSRGRNDRNGDPWYYRVTIDPSRVPAGVSAFRVKFHRMGAVVRESLRREMKRAKVTGVDFYLP